MMLIDWSKAPNGANYRDAVGNWLRFKNNQWFAWSGASGGYWFTIGKHNLQKPPTQKIVSTVTDLLDFGYLVSPTLHMQFCGRVKRNPQWSDDGLPPAGTVCEFKSVGHHSDPEYQWCIYHGKMSCGGYIVEYHHHTSPSMTTCAPFDPALTSFRPIKSAEQIVAEKREKAIDELRANAPGIAWKSAAAIYDAGYRKITP